MSEQMVTIEATSRTQTGKGYARKLRREGKIPGVLMENGKSTMLELNPKLLSKAYLGGRKFNMTFNGQTRVVEIKDVAIDVVKRLPLHVDLMYAK